MLLSPQLSRTIRIFRYCAYLSLVGLGFWQAWQDLVPVSHWIVTLILIPLVWQDLSDRGYRGWAHTLEALCVPALLWQLDFETCALAFAALMASCNLALWGARTVPGVVAALVLLVLATQESFPTVVFAVWLISFAHYVHGQTQHHLDRKAELKAHQSDLLKFLPREFDDEQHRRDWLTIGFVDLGGFTQAVDQMSPEMTRGMLNQFLDHVVNVVEAAGGSAHKFLGDGVLCVFAAKDLEARCESAQRCVNAMLELVGWMPEFVRIWRRRGCMLNFDLSAGIASGDCSIGRWGGGERCDFTVIGRPVNLAQRLQAAANDTQPILIDEVTAELVGREQLGLRRTIEPKGMAICEAYPVAPGLLQKA